MGETTGVFQQNLCPKCGADLIEKAIACVKCGAQVAKAKPEKIELTAALKIAAGVFILNGFSLIAEAILTKDPQAAHTLRGALVSVIIGGYLFTGKASALKWAKIAAVLGGVLYTVINVAQNDVTTAVIQFVFSLSLAGLLFGRPGKLRLVTCSLLLLLYFGLEVLGIFMPVDKPAPQTITAPKT